ncbi:hypothetical protein [Sphingomonas phyllosphaerae]|uniref:hypothetical protein n=1 Tax=Sphingomonas phyllosphaerae TaxID=257003 RepID=UPI0012DD49B1|nr:hypothetical protein [Sphingomonas phyllosphaerae]
MGSFTVVPLIAQRILSVRVEGNLSLNDVEELKTAQRSAIDLVGWLVQEYSLIVDITDAKIQDTSVASALDKLRTDPSLEPSRLAFVHGSSPAKLQVRRLATQRGDGVFETSAEARDWLNSGSRRGS